VRDDPKRFKFDADEFYLKTAAEMRELFADYEEACDNTLWVAERADVEIEFGIPSLPTFGVPEGYTEDSYLKELVFLPEGRGGKPWWTWTRGLVLHHGDHTASAYVIKEIKGVKYMFFEWKSGDYVFRGAKPFYYVLKKK